MQIYAHIFMFSFFFKIVDIIKTIIIPSYVASKKKRAQDHAS